MRDYVAARDDAERGLELAEAIGDRRTMADNYFQASLIAQRQGHYVLSRSYAQRAKELYQQVNDERNVGRLHLMLGGLTLLLGDEERRRRAPEGVLLEGARCRFARGRRTGARGHRHGCISNRGEYDQADELARKSLALLQGREDYLHEVSPSQLVLGRALLERGRLDEAEECFRAADAAAEQMASISHRTEAWVALGISRRVEVTTARPRVSTGTPPRRSRKSASRERRVAMKPRLLLLLVNLALLAAWLGQLSPWKSWPDGS